MVQSLQYPTTSLQYSFGNLDVDLIIRDAFLRCGIKNNQISGVDYLDAQNSLNFVLSEWPNYGLNLFTVIQYVIPVVNYQFVYSLPPNTSKVLEGIMVQNNNILGGTPSSSAGGNALSAFTYPFQAPCTQTSSNGNISYLYNTPQPILYVGIESYTTQQYTISIDCSFLQTPAEGDWINILNTSTQPYYFGLPVWFSLPTTQNAINWRIRETNGATLNIAQIFFSIPSKSQPMNPESREDYTKQTLNTAAGTPGVYWANRVNPLVVRIYGTPINPAYNFFVFNCARYIQDCGSFQNSIDANSRFIEPAAAGLAAKLSMKYAVDRYQMLTESARMIYDAAGREDTENVPSQVQFSMDGGFA